MTEEKASMKGTIMTATDLFDGKFINLMTKIEKAYRNNRLSWISI